MVVWVSPLNHEALHLNDLGFHSDLDTAVLAVRRLYGEIMTGLSGA